MEPILQATLALIGVVALIFALFFLTKKVNKHISVTDSRSMKVLERINLGAEKIIILVSICGKCMVLGVTSHHIDKICDLDITEAEITAKNAQGISFLESLKTVLNQKPSKIEKTNEIPKGDEENYDDQTMQ